jgi:hypothetical protein
VLGRIAAGLSALIAAVALTACGSSGTNAASSPAAISVAGGTGCAADHRQNLVLSGAIVGHLLCDAEGQPTCDFIYAGKPTEHAFTAAIHAIAGGKPLLLSFAVYPFNGPGAYASDNVEGGTTITLDGPTHWAGQVGDAIVVASADPHVLSGSLNSTLTDGSARPIQLHGTWVCDRHG